ncbi:hypothetical protein [Amycolatopsis sp. NPDC051102]|uniref:hypothetical protein n=1 Tax=Amycolatopsis sp. NPDC051102 TaxID=3155163 RepID=UPI0034270A1E
MRDVLTNPKHTGHMVRIWSAQPVHEALVTLEDWLQAQEFSQHRFGSRSASNTSV